MVTTETINESLEERLARVRSRVDRVLSCISEGSDHYVVLGIESDASSDAIRQAYCEAVETFHPLKCQELTESDGAMRWRVSQAFLRVVEAFTTLSRPARRIDYDATINRKPPLPLPLPTFPDPQRPGERTNLADDATLPPVQKYVIGNLFGHAGVPTPKLPSAGQRTRLPLRVPVRVTSEEGHWQEVTESREVSRDNIQFKLSCPVDSGTMLRLELPMPVEFRTHSHGQLIYTVKAVVELSSESDGEGYWVRAQFTNASVVGV